MAVTASTAVGVTSIAPGTITAASNTSGYLSGNRHAGYGYNPLRDTWFDIPAQDFQCMRYEDQLHYARHWERKRELEERARREYEYAEYSGKLALSSKPDDFKDAVKKMAEPSWKSNTKLLLTEN